MYLLPVMALAPGAAGGVRKAATLRRSADLLRVFRLEQTKPDVFYSFLADDAANQVSAYVDVDGATLVDVGGGPGYFAQAFMDRGAKYVPLDADAGELRLHGRTPMPGTVIGDGARLPFRSNSVDVCYSSNVAEHVPDPWIMADEMVRITRPGGWIFLSYTLWYGPWGGHETSPWHFLGGARAAKRYERTQGHPPKNVYGESMFKVTAAAGLRWAKQCNEARLVEAAPRYLPGWSWSVIHVPAVRELVVWNLLLVMRKR
ncbi:MAG: class I SAM-dependent methyltransferase [Actinomycetes bacterium]